MRTTKTITQLPLETQRQPQRQLPFTVFPITISTLLAEPDRYIIPEMQRDDVWPELWKRVLIESIFEGDIIEALLLHKRVHEDGSVCYEIINGRQRFSAIKGFYENQFRTLTNPEAERGDVGGEVPIEPGRIFKELTVMARNIFLNFEMTVLCVENIDRRTLEKMFRRGNRYSLKMTASENLASYHSQSVDYARMLTHHSVWSELYQKKSRRRQEVLGALYTLIIEKSGGIYASLSTPVTDKHGSGVLDNEYTDGLYQRALTRYDGISYLFHGSVFTTIPNIIPLYQLMVVLEEKGDSPFNYERGCLTPWFMSLIHHKLGHGYGDRFRKMINMNRQREFWEDHSKKVSEILERNRVGIALLPAKIG